MAASASKSTNLYAPASNQYPYVLSVSFTENSTSIANNTSSITASASLGGKNIAMDVTNGGTLYLYWHDNRTNSDTLISSLVISQCGIDYGTKTTSGTIDVQHNADGTLSGYVYAKWNKDRNYAYVPATGSVQTDWTALTTIPRTTAAVNVTGTIESSTTITISPASSSFTHSIKLLFGNSIKYLNANGGLSSSEVKLSGTSFKFNVPKDYYAEFTGTKGSGSVVFYTYSGSTQIGNATGTLTINVSAATCKPAISGTVKDVNAVTLALTNDENSLVNGRSNARITPSIRVSSVNDAYGYLTSTTVVNSKNETVDIKGWNFYDDASATKSGYVITAKNSRGGSASTTLNITGNFVPYRELTIDNNGKNSDLFDRVTETGNQVQAGFKGNFYAGYFDISNSANPNVLSLKWYVKKSEYDDWTLGGTLIEGTDYTINAEKNTYASNGEILLTSPFDDGTWNYKQKYYFKMVATDLLNPIDNPVVYNQYLKVGLPVINWYNKNDVNHLNVNGMLDINGTSVVDFFHPVGSIYITTNANVDPNNWGGTWEKLTGDAYLKIVTSNAGKYGGVSGHKISVDYMPSHTHTFTGKQVNTGYQSADHSHYMANGYSYNSGSSPGAYTVATSNSTQGYDTNATTYTSGITAGHVHAFTASGSNSNTGGGNAYYPYYYGVYVWHRKG